MSDSDIRNKSTFVACTKHREIGGTEYGKAVTSLCVQSFHVLMDKPFRWKSLVRRV